MTAQPPRMHADELEVSASLVRALVGEQFPDWAALPVERVESWGTDNALYRLGADKVVRLPRREPNEVSLEKELRWLPRLAPSLPLEVPVPLASGRPGAGYPFGWAVYSWLVGEPATVDRLADPVEAAQDVAGFLRALQSIDTAGAPLPGAHNVGRGQPLAKRDAATRAAVKSLRGELDADAVTRAWEEALATPEWDRPPVWVHGDLDARNLLVRDGRIAAVLDFGCLAAGDPACDVMVAWKLFDAEARDAFRTALPIDDAMWARSRGWAVSQAVVALAYYTLETNPVLVRESGRWLAAVLADRYG